jgi:hypothetical protein
VAGRLTFDNPHKKQVVSFTNGVKTTSATSDRKKAAPVMALPFWVFPID